MLFIRLFGQPRLTLDQQTLPFNAPPKTLPLLAYLLLHRSQPLERQQVAFTFWPDDAEPAARANLRRHLHWLGRLLPDTPANNAQPWLLSSPSTIQWNPLSEFWLDVAEFERGCADSNALEEAVSLYTGDLLETSYDDWIFFERERLREMYFAALNHLIIQQRCARQYAQALAFAQQLLGRDPFREDAARQVIALRYEMGDRAGAIAEYERFATRLRQEMGVAPMPETQSLHETVLRQGRLPGALQSGVAETAEPGGLAPLGGLSSGLRPTIPLLPFVGRQSELERLQARWSRAARGVSAASGGLLLLSGEAGVGKTRLTRELALQAESQGARLLSGGETPGASIPYQSIVEAFQSALPLLASLKGETQRLAALSALLPDLRQRRELPQLPPLNPDQERLRLLDAAAGILESMAGPRPLLLILEDLHWASESSLALLEFLTRRIARLPVLIIGTYREEDTHRGHPLRLVRRRLEQEKLAEHLALRRLNEQAVSAMLEQFHLSDRSAGAPDGNLAQRLFTASEGNPLFLEMLLRSWQETGLLEETALPQRLKTAITLRLGQLSPPGRAYAEMAAVFGPLFDAEAAREAGGWDECQALDALDELLDRRLVRDLGRLNEYTFAHHLIQSTLYSEIPPPRRKRRHRRIAEVLESLYPERQDELAGALAQHYDQGGDPARAAPRYLAAARRYLEVFANDEALAALDRALHLAAEMDEQAVTLATRFELLALRETIYHRRGQRAEQWADAQAMESLARRLDAPQRICLALERQAHCLRLQDHHEQEQELVQALKAQAQAMGDMRWQAVALHAQGLCHLSLSNFQQAITCHEEALGLFQELGDPGGMLGCYCSLANIHVHLRQSEQAQTWIEKALAMGEQNPARLLQTLASAGAAALVFKDLPRCLEYSQRLLELAQRANDLNFQAAALNLIGQVSYRRFEMAEARRNLLIAKELYQRIQKFSGVVTALSNLALLETDLGHYSQALEYYRQINELNQRTGDLYQQTIALLNQSYTISLMEDYPAEAAFARQGLELARQIQNRYLEAVALGNLGEAERELDDPEAAILHLQESIQVHREQGEQSESPDTTNTLADLALAYALAGDLEKAAQTAAELEQLYPVMCEKTGDPHRLLWAAGRAWQACGQPEQARQAMATAYAFIQEKMASIPDPATRLTYSKISFNRQVIAAHERGEWP